MKKYIPNTLSFLRIFLSIFIVYFFTKASAQALTLLFPVLAASDFFDGFLARKWRCTTRLGAILDPAADKLLINIYLTGLFLVWGEVPFVLCVLSLLRDVLIVVGFLLLSSKIKEITPVFISKVNTLCLCLYILLVTFKIAYCPEGHMLLCLAIRGLFFLSIGTIFLSLVQYLMFFIRNINNEQ